jgi:hypothetical protein
MNSVHLRCVEGSKLGLVERFADKMTFAGKNFGLLDRRGSLVWRLVNRNWLENMS